MAGLCGTIGPQPPTPDTMLAGLEWTGTEHTTSFDGDRVTIRGAFLDDTAGGVAHRGNTTVVAWGTLYGFDGPDGYEPRPADGRTTADYLADRYDRHGRDCLAGVNGEFVAVIRDAAGRIHLCTDRYAVRDTYYTRLGEDCLAFSTQIQSLSLLPGVTPAFDTDMVREHFAARRTFGVHTPLEDTTLLAPGGVLTVQPSGGARSLERYWRPRFRPVERPFSIFVDELVSRLRAAMADRTRHAGRAGVLLSGGSDSRLVLAAARERGPVTAFHMGDWQNTEARTAERVAQRAGADFEFLRRDVDYQARALRRTPAHSNFVGTFNQAHAHGFTAQLRSTVDVVFDGLVSNHLFRGVKVPRYGLDIPRLGRLDFPVRRSMDTIDAFLESLDHDPPAYLTDRRSVRPLLRARISRVPDGVRHHGLTYAAPRDLFLVSDVVPLANKNGCFMAQHLRGHVAHSSPFLDNRLVELALSMPVRYRVRRDPVDAALASMAPALAEIPHAETGVKPSRSFPTRYLERYARSLYDNCRPAGALPPTANATHGPWPDNDRLLREHPAFEEALLAHQDTVEALPFLDWDGVRACFQAHQDGADNYQALYRLLTFLEMPVTGRVVRAQEGEG